MHSTERPAVAVAADVTRELRQVPDLDALDRAPVRRGGPQGEQELGPSSSLEVLQPSSCSCGLVDGPLGSGPAEPTYALRVASSSSTTARYRSSSRFTVAVLGFRRL